MQKTSAVICAYNEENTIRDVIINISQSQMIDEIIVVNDGSTDDTGKIIKNLKRKIEFNDIHLSRNKGKGYALATGVRQSSGDFIVFFDADLSHLNTIHVHQLLDPLLNDEVDMVLGQATETFIKYSINPFKSFTGERALKKKDILPIIEKIRFSKFGVETLINLHYLSNQKNVRYVMLNELIHPTKFEKANASQAIIEFIIEGYQITSTTFNNFDLVIKTVKNSILRKIIQS